MTEKELRKKVIGNNFLSNSLLALKIIFDLIPQVLLVYLLASLITQNISEENIKYIFLNINTKNEIFVQSLFFKNYFVMFFIVLRCVED